MLDFDIVTRPIENSADKGLGEGVPGVRLEVFDVFSVLKTGVSFEYLDSLELPGDLVAKLNNAQSPRGGLTVLERYTFPQPMNKKLRADVERLKTVLYKNI